MNIHDIKETILEAIPNAVVRVGGDGVHFDVEIVTDAFQGLSSLKRQQIIYALFSHAIQSGELHALNLKTLTPDEQKQ